LRLSGEYPSVADPPPQDALHFPNNIPTELELWAESYWLLP